MPTIQELELGLERAQQAGDEAAVYEISFFLERAIKQEQAAQMRQSKSPELDMSPDEEVDYSGLDYDEEPMNALTGGLSRGIDIMGEGVGSAIEGFGKVTGLEGVEEFGSEMVEDNQAQLEDAENYATRRQDVEGIGTGAEYFFGTLGETLPQMATAIGAGALAVAAAPAALTVGAGAMIVGAVGAGLSQIPFFYGMNRERQKDAIERGDGVAELDEGTAFLSAIPQAAMEGIVDRMLVGKFFTPKVIREGGVFSRVAKGAGAGAAVEVPTEVGQQMIERAQAGLDLQSDEAITEYIDAAVAAGMIGGSFGGTAAGVGGRYTAPAEEAGVDPDGKWVAYKNSDDNTFSYHDAETGNVLFTGILEGDRAQVEADIEASKAAQAELDAQAAPAPETVESETVTTEEAEAVSGADIDEVVGTEEVVTDDTQATAPKEEDPVFDEDGRRVETTAERAPPVEAPIDPEVKRVAQVKTLTDAGVPIEMAERTAEETFQQDIDKARVEEIVATGAATKAQAARIVKEQRKAAEAEAKAEQKRVEEVAKFEEAAAEEGFAEETVVEPAPVVEAEPVKEGDVLSIFQLLTGVSRQQKQGAANTKVTKVKVLENGDKVFVGKDVDTGETVTWSDNDGGKTLVNPTSTEVQAVVDEYYERNKPKVQPAPVVEAAPVLVTKEDLDAIGIPKSAPIRNRVIGQDKNVQGTKDQLLAYSTNKTVQKKPKLVAAINEYTLGPVPEGDTRTFEFTEGFADLPERTATGEKKTLLEQTREEVAVREEADTKQKLADEGKLVPDEKGESTYIDVEAPEFKQRNPNTSRVEEDSDATAHKGMQAMTVTTAKEARSSKRARHGRGRAIYSKAGERITDSIDLAAYDAVNKVNYQNYAAKQAGMPKVFEGMGSGTGKAYLDSLRADPNISQKVKTYIDKAMANALPMKALPKNVTLEQVTATSGNNADTSSKIRDELNAKDEFNRATTDPEVAKLAAETAAAKKRAKEVKAANKAGKALVGTRNKELQKAEADLAKARAEGDAPAVRRIEGKIEDAQRQAKREEDEAAKVASQEYADVDMYDDLSTLDFSLPADSTVNLDVPLHPIAKGLLARGDLKGALELLRGTTGSVHVRDLTTAFLDNVGTTKIEVVSDLKNSNGEKANGLFDPKTNTIKLDAETGINTHVLLHEMGHVVTAEALSKPSHPATKKLQAIFKEVVPRLGTVRGAANLDEFVAEVQGNVEFRQELAGIHLKGNPASVLQQINNILANIWRRLMGKPTKSLESDISALQSVDSIIYGIMSPAPDSRYAGELLHAAASTVVANQNALQEGVNSAGGMKDWVLNGFSNFLPWAKPKSKKYMMSVLDMDTMVEISKYEGYQVGYTVPNGKRVVQSFPTKKERNARVIELTANPAIDNGMIRTPVRGLEGESMNVDGVEQVRKLLDEQNGALKNANDDTKAQLAVLNKWKAQATPAQIAALEMIAPESTLARVDPNDPVTAYSQWHMAYRVGDAMTRRSFNSKDNRDAAIKQYNANNPEYKAKKDGAPSAEKVKSWKAMRPSWNALGKDGRAIYNNIVQVYQNKHRELYDAAVNNYDTMDGLNDDTRKTLKDELFERMYGEEGIRPYLPLVRKGDHWLRYDIPNPDNAKLKIEVVEAFGSIKQRNDAKAEVIANSPSGFDPGINEFNQISPVSFDRAPPASFVKKTMDAINESTANDKDKSALQTQIMRVYIQTLPETSAARSRLKRKGTLGFIKDPIVAMEERLYAITRETAKLTTSRNLMAAGAKMREKYKPGPDSPVTENQQLIVNEVLDRINFAVNPPADGIARTLNRVAFNFTIGLNASSALVNTTQIPLFVLPQFAGVYGFGKTLAALSKASKLYFGSGTVKRRRLMAQLDGESYTDAQSFAGQNVDNYYVTDADGNYQVRDDLPGLDDVDKKTGQTRREYLQSKAVMVQIAAARGQVDSSLIQDEQGLSFVEDPKSLIEKTQRASAFMFHKAEVMTRQITMMAAYDLEMQRMQGKNKASRTQAEEKYEPKQMQVKAAESAMALTQKVNGGASLETGMRLSRQGLGRVGMMYKSFGVRMYTSMLQNALQIARNVAPGTDARSREMRNAAIQQLAGTFGSSILFAGVKGIPIFGAVALIYNTMLKEDDEEDFETVVQKQLTQGWYKGAPTAMLGVDVSNRIGLSNLLFQTNRYNQDASMEEDIAHYFGGPAWSILSNFGRGYEDIVQNGNLERGLETMLPAAIKNMYKGVVRYRRDEGALTRRGDFIWDDPSQTELAAQVLGFAPSEYTFVQEKENQKKRIEGAAKKRRTKLLRRRAKAERDGDFMEYYDIMDNISEFNLDYPLAAITKDTIERSRRAYGRATAETINGVRYSKMFRATLEQHEAEYQESESYF